MSMGIQMYVVPVILLSIMMIPAILLINPPTAWVSRIWGGKKKRTKIEPEIR